MLGTKVFILISTFTKEEIKEFELYVCSPFFTSGKNYPTEKLILLVSIIAESFPDLKNGNLDRKQIYKKLYGSKPYKDSNIRNLFSDLKELAEGYLKEGRAKCNDFEREHNLLIELFNRKLDKEFSKQLNFCYKLLEGRELNSEYYYDRFRTTDYLSFFKGRKLNLNQMEVQDAYKDFNCFYLIRALQQFILMVNMGNLIKFDFRIPMYNEVMNHIETNINDYKNIPGIIIYYTLIRMLSLKEEKYFFELKQQLHRFENKLDVIDRNNLYICLGNFCLEEITKGNANYHREKFENDKAYLASGLIYGKHFFHLNLFMSMSMNALDLGEYEWTENFVLNNIAHVAPEMQEFAENYIFAELYYRKNSYEDSLKRLAFIKIENPYNKQLIRNLTLKIYYELGYLDEAMAMAETSLKFLNVSEVEDFTGRDDLLLFIKYYISFIKLVSKDTPEIAELKTLLHMKIEKTKHFRNRQWLLDKLAHG